MTKHSIKRAKQRANLSHNAAIKLFYSAYLMGKTSKDVPTRERTYLEEKSSNNCKAIYYSGYCFIFSADGVCITMYHVPQWFLNRTYYDGKIQVKKPKRYYAKYVAAD